MTKYEKCGIIGIYLKKGEFMIELINKQNLLHDLYTLDISLEDMEKVENYINNYETMYYVGEDLLNQEEYNKYLDFFDKLWYNVNK